MRDLHRENNDESKHAGELTDHDGQPRYFDDPHH
jgi:hypothetical protein